MEGRIFYHISHRCCEEFRHIHMCRRQYLFTSIMRELVRLTFTSAIAFMAIIPAAIGIILTHHQSEWSRSDGSSWRNLRWYRRIIATVTFSLVIVLISSVTAAGLLIGYIDIPAWLPLAILLFSVSVTALGVTTFILLYYVSEKPSDTDTR